MALRRGFKTEANVIAEEVRTELGLRPTASLDAWRLAGLLDIPVFPLSQFVLDAPKAVKMFMGSEEGTFSAVTVFHGSARIIVHNDAHVKGRQASDIAHELSHALLHHPPMPAFDHRGCRDWDDELEQEAKWLSGALLIPDKAALDIVRQGLGLELAAETYGVTKKMVQYRLNVTGAFNRINRERIYWKSNRP